MIGLDTNVLIRHLTQDDPVQSPRASAFIETGLTAEEPGFVSVVALAEVVWVLDSAYKYGRVEIAGAVELLLRTATFVVENEYQAFLALVALKKGEASFTDALIGALGTRAGCSSTATFDRKAARQAGFTLL